MNKPLLSAQAEDLIPRPEVARSFGVVPRTVKRWEALYGLTPFTITSRLVCYPASQIEKLRANARAIGGGGNETTPTIEAKPARSNRARK